MKMLADRDMCDVEPENDDKAHFRIYPNRLIEL